MMYAGTVVETFQSTYGHGVKLNTERGEWKVFGKGPPPALPPGTAVEFDAVQKGNSWNYTNLRPAGGAFGGPPVPPVAPMQPRAAPAQPLPTPPSVVATNEAKDRTIFITGVVGRAMGSGQFPTTEMRALTLAAAEAWDALHGPRPQPSPPRQAQQNYDPNEPPPWS